MSKSYFYVVWRNGEKKRGSQPSTVLYYEINFLFGAPSSGYF